MPAEIKCRAASYLLIVSVLCYSLVSIFYEWIVPFAQECLQRTDPDNKWPNPAYPSDPCFDSERHPFLLALTLQEAESIRRIVFSALLGGAIGIERRMQKQPAGIRTLSIVSIGACIFTLNSMFAFTRSSMAWDSSRVTAAIPSGVGFLGAGLIWKSAERGNDLRHSIRGLTTAASLWVSAAIGVSCGGGLYAVALFGTIFIFLVLRIKKIESILLERLGFISREEDRGIDLEQGSIESGSDGDVHDERKKSH